MTTPDPAEVVLEALLDARVRMYGPRQTSEHVLAKLSEHGYSIVQLPKAQSHEPNALGYLQWLADKPDSFEHYQPFAVCKTPEGYVEYWADTPDVPEGGPTRVRWPDPAEARAAALSILAAAAAAEEDQ